MAVEPLTIVFGAHSVQRIRERVPRGHGIVKGSFIRLMLVRQSDKCLRELWVLRSPNALVLGVLKRIASGEHIFFVRTVFSLANLGRRQRKPTRQFIPLSARLFLVKAIRAASAHKSVASMDTRIRRPFAYAVEKSGMVLRVCPTLAAVVDLLVCRFGQPVPEPHVTAWFTDGTSQPIPVESLCTPDFASWINPGDARRLEAFSVPAPDDP
jgi:hypothetical protein